MNIKSYYKMTAQTYMNGSIVSLLIALCCTLLFFNTIGTISWVMYVPFLLYSFILIGFSYLYDFRAREVVMEQINTPHQLIHQKDVLLTYLPAPTLRMAIFHPNGQKLGELRDESVKWWKWFIPKLVYDVKKTKYVLLDEKNEIIARYIVENERQLTAYSSEGMYLGGFKQKAQSVIKVTGELHGQNLYEKESITISNLYDVRLAINGKEEGCRIVHGWLPIEWGKRFKELDQPRVIFNHDVNEKEKALLFGMVAYLYNQRNH